MRLRKGRLYTVLTIILIIFLTVCYFINKNQSSKKINVSHEDEIIYEDNIRIGISNYDTMNPILTKNNMVMSVNQLIYEPLFKIGTGSKLEPCLAKEYAKSSANSYVIKIDDSIKWSNGENVSAKDVKYTIDIIKSRENIFSENLRNVESSEVIDNTTIKIVLAKEVPFFEYNLTFPIMSQKHYDGIDFFSSNKIPIGTGRYKIESIGNNQVILNKNDQYRDEVKTNKNISKIYINIFSEIGEVYNSFKLGNIDILNPSNSKYKNVIGTLGYHVKEYRGREYDFLSLNYNDTILKDKAVRQALNYAIDKNNIISTIYNNDYSKAEYFLDYGNYLYNSNSSYYNYDTEKAKQLLINSGWSFTNNKWRKNGLMLNLTITVNSSNKKRVESAKLIKSQLDEFGMNVNIRELSDYEYNQCITNKTYQILFTGIYNGYSPDLEMFYGENNLANYTNDIVKSLLKDVKNITDEKLLKQKYEEIINQTQDDCSYIGLYRNKRSLVVSKKMSGNFEPSNYSIISNFETWNRAQ